MWQLPKQTHVANGGKYRRSGQRRGHQQQRGTDHTLQQQSAQLRAAECSPRAAHHAMRDVYPLNVDEERAVAVMPQCHTRCAQPRPRQLQETNVIVASANTYRVECVQWEACSEVALHTLTRILHGSTRVASHCSTQIHSREANTGGVKDDYRNTGCHRAYQGSPGHARSPPSQLVKVSSPSCYVFCSRS